jgi:transcriptional regulator with PAS, ATPase and Fis domain
MSEQPIYLEGAGLQEPLRILEQIADTDISVLLVGETGTGKEILANHLHNLSRYKAKTMVALNCSTFPGELLESELFGSVKGAFTGSIRDRQGLILFAHENTLFLDELASMPYEQQAKLLRFLQNREIRRVGEVVSMKVECRIVAALNSDPEHLMLTGKLRDDLYYRISVVTVKIPPLRERQDEIEPLLTKLNLFFSEKFNRPCRPVRTEILEKLIVYPWPGNLRQLVNEIQRAVLLSPKNDLVFSEEVLHYQQPLVLTNGSLSKLDIMEREAIIKALLTEAWNIKRVAQILGLGRQTLYNKIEKYGIERPPNEDGRCNRVSKHVNGELADASVSHVSAAI